MPTVPQTPPNTTTPRLARTLALLGSIGATEEEATREAIVVATHALLAIAAAVIRRRD